MPTMMKWAFSYAADETMHAQYISRYQFKNKYKKKKKIQNSQQMGIEL